VAANDLHASSMLVQRGPHSGNTGSDSPTDPARNLLIYRMFICL